MILFDISIRFQYSRKRTQNENQRQKDYNQLKKILMDHLVEFCKIEDVDDENKVVTIEQVIKKVKISGHEIYDCDWSEELLFLI